MKKLMFAAALAACSAAFAVTSSNVVGYQEKPLVGGENNYVCGTFMKIGTEPSTLADIIANDAFEFGNDTLVLLNADGTTFKQAYWVNAELAAENEIDAGWYDATAWDEEEELINLNNEEVAFGTSYVISCVNNGVCLTYAGQVMAGDTDLSLNASENNYVGNCTPVQITLGDIVANDAFEFGNDTLVLLNADGTTFKQAYWVSTELAEENEIDAGWYDATAWDEEEELVNLNSENIAAGLGFVISCVNGGVKIRIPSPLN